MTYKNDINDKINYIKYPSKLFLTFNHSDLKLIWLLQLRNYCNYNKSSYIRMFDCVIFI